MNDKRKILRHFLATLAYRAQRALLDAPDSFADFQAGNEVRTPLQILCHMTGCIHWSIKAFAGGKVSVPELPSFAEEVTRFHDSLESLSKHLDESELQESTLERLLQGPLSDAMTHIGQLAMLRRMHGSPVKGEHFRAANINANNLGPDQ